ncbi:MAG TPA: substrate-binding domain-containing protein, partial [Candidatus Pelethocola excrementipullorum]|nr:substrate-binding domain-containing protein [Candidatus Pelethocola excrementipullorum]
PKSMEERYIRWLIEAAEEGKYIPIVSTERDFTKYGVDSITFDGRRGAYKAVEHLINCECKKICHITGPSHMDIVNDRMNGYIEAMEDAGFVIDRNTMIVEGNFSHQSGYEGMKKILEYIPDVDGVFAGNDQMAVGIMKSLKESKINVPEDIKIVGFDDVYVSSVLEPPLTTVHIEKKEIGIAAAKILFDRIDEGGRERAVHREVIDTQLVIRQSTVKDAPAGWISTEW